MASAPRLSSAQVLMLLALLCAVAIVLFMTLNLKGNLDFALPFRARKVWGMALVGAAIAISSVLFQTVTANRILTPAIMGFDHLYQFVQTGLVFLFGGFAYATLDPQLKFVGNVLTMVVLASLLFRWLFGRAARSLHLMVLVGIVFGVLFRSLSETMQRLINPNDFAVLQDAFFANFNAIEPTLLVAATIAIGAASMLALPLLPRLDVLLLGREAAIGLGVDHRRTVSLTLALVAVLVSVSTALVGPVLFFGLLVANLAYVIVPGHRHAVVLPAAVLLAITGLAGGQAVLEHGLGFNSALSIIIEFAGGIAFLYFLIRSTRR